MPRVRRVVFWLGWCLAGAGCQPKIGDDCGGPTDCSQAGDRICDFTQPNGYCTQFNCEPGTCPPEAVCVQFSTDLAPILECIDEQARPRTARTFCMRRCATDLECRSLEGYECTTAAELEVPNPWGARVLLSSREPEFQGLCQTPFEDGAGVLPDENGSAGVCSEDLPPGEMSVADASAPEAGPADAAAPDAAVSDAGTD